MMIYNALTTFAISVILPLSYAADSRWQAAPPAFMKNGAQWQSILDHLLAKDLNYGAMATASRMLIFLPDLTSKEAAYRAIIKIIDRGYPFSAQQNFLSGDIQPQDDYDFANSYNLYKAILNRRQGSERWAENYFTHIDKEGFPKYLFYLALEAYSQKNYIEAETQLKKILTKDAGDPIHLSFIAKVTRTLARVYFDQEKYDLSLEIYTTFLLKLNPMTPTDWIEAAWNLYHLKRYPEALGMVYNLESQANDGTVDLEKYTIRALAYRELCAGDQADALIRSFENDFHSVITGIKRGQPLTSYSVLSKIRVNQSEIYRQIRATLSQLRLEGLRVNDLPKDDRALANSIYATEIRAQLRRAQIYQDKALEGAASALTLLSEQLKFLKYDVAREKYNPDAIFKAPTSASAAPLIERFDDKYVLHWLQFGDFWRDERNSFKGSLVSQCKD
jgi:tetratricopeptide (TPR) repeat protein